uniref:tRNA (uracil-O(2)-)-methyltransferase n=1 Tax=Cacopsylla melanoneura TaxID=428564 RepID=A0A8D9DWW8_9HEMI
MNDNFTTVKEMDLNFSSDEFLTSINIWISKPHTLNKRVLSIEPILQFNVEHLAVQQITHMKDLILSGNENVKDTLESYVKSLPSGNVSVQIRKLIPRSVAHFEGCVELVVEDYDNLSFLFYNLSLCTANKKSIVCVFPYMIQFDEHSRKLYLKVKSQCKAEESFQQNAKSATEEVPESPSCTPDTKTSDHTLTNSHQAEALVWLQNTLLPKLIKWAENSFKMNSQSLVQNSLQLINMSQYSTLYNTMKTKYGKQITEIWPEVTDPSKFVYEDLAIASYLICLWGKRPTRYVDLGCGNGLLVHILNSEGHQGFGIDVRKRKIWDLYPPTTVLKVDVITPSASTLFPDTDWIIGNHSDELTPWIPIITTRSSASCKLFLLPCCAYQFDGHKYQRRNSRLSIYNDYLQYISRDICSNLCRFNVELDRLRIPSTKRIAIVCRSRQYGAAELDKVDESIGAFLKGLERKEGVEKELEDKENGEKDERSDEQCGLEENNVFEDDDANGSVKTSKETVEENKPIDKAENDHSEDDKLGYKIKEKHQKDEELAPRSKKLKTNDDNIASLDNLKTNDTWMKNIKTRDNKETVRNCTQINRNIEQAIVDIIVKCLLEKQLDEGVTSWNHSGTLQQSVDSVETDTGTNQSSPAGGSTRETIHSGNVTNSEHGNVPSTADSIHKKSNDISLDSIEKNDNNNLHSSSNSTNKNVIVAIPLAEIVREIRAQNPTYLAEISRQNGGIKTLIRNRHAMFCVENNAVQFRMPRLRDRSGLTHAQWKCKPCWFEHHHPFRCPLKEEECSFQH